MIGAVWRWYRRVGKPILFYSPLSPQECARRIEANSAPWEGFAPLRLRRYKAQIGYDGQFQLKRRFGLREMPFIGQLDPLPTGGTRVSGYLSNDVSYLGFVALLSVAAPLLGWLGFATPGLIVGVVVVIALIIGALVARLTEEKSIAGAAMQTWLMEILQGQPLLTDRPLFEQKPEQKR